MFNFNNFNKFIDKAKIYTKDYVPATRKFVQKAVSEALEVSGLAIDRIFEVADKIDGRIEKVEEGIKSLTERVDLTGRKVAELEQRVKELEEILDSLGIRNVDHSPAEEVIEEEYPDEDELLLEQEDTPRIQRRRV